MKCNTCEYNFALLDDDFDGTQIHCKYKNCVVEIKEKKKKDHKCYSCPWGTWAGLKYKCALPRCIPNLGNFNGVDKNVKQKNL